MSTRKVQPVSAVAGDVRRLQRTGARVVFTNGCFDILHPGHVKLFARARAAGDALVVAINSDASVRRLKGPDRPVFSEDERAEILAAMRDVDWVCIFGDDTPLETILEIRPDVLVKGADWKEKGIVGQREVESWGGKVVAVDLVEGHSTSEVVSRVVERFQPPRKGDGGSAASS